MTSWTWNGDSGKQPRPQQVCADVHAWLFEEMSLLNQKWLKDEDKTARSLMPPTRMPQDHDRAPALRSCPRSIRRVTSVCEERGRFNNVDSGGEAFRVSPLNYSTGPRRRRLLMHAIWRRQRRQTSGLLE